MNTDNNHPSDILKNAEKLIELKKYEEAEDILKNIYQSTKNHEIGILLGKVLSYQFKYNEAIYLFLEVAQNGCIRNYDIMLYTAKLDRWIGQAPSAEKGNYLFLEVFPEDELGSLDLVDTLYEQSKCEDGLQIFNKYKHTEQFKDYKLFLEAKYFNKKGLYLDSIHILEKFNKNNSNPELDVWAQLLLIDNYYHIEAFEEWLEQINKASKVFSNHHIVNFWMAFSNIKNKKFIAAKKVVDNLHKNYQGIYGLPYSRLLDGYFYWKTGNKYSTSTIFGSYMPMWFDELVGLKYFFFAQNYPSHKEFQLDTLLKLAELENMPKLNYYIGLIYLKVYKEYKTAISYFSKSVEKLPQHISSWVHLEECYLEKEYDDDDNIKIEEIYKQILSINPNHEWARVNYDMILEAENEEEESDDDSN